MRAILIATESSPTGPSHVTNAMRMLLDRPLIQRLVEMIAARGVRQIDVVLSDDAAAVESALGNGSRWGVSLRYHLVAGEGLDYRSIHAVTNPDADEPILLGHVDHLIGVCPDSDHGHSAILYMSGATVDRWTGWALVRGRHLQGIDAACDRDGLAARLAAGGREVVVEDALAIHDDRSALEAQSAMLSGRFAQALRSGKEVEAGIWLSRNVRLHPTARLIAPVHVGEDCRIGPGVTIGPNVAVGAGSMIDAGTSVSDVIIAARTYIGRGLDLSRMIVDRNRIVSVDSGTIVEPRDATIVSGVDAGSTPAAIRDFVDRVAALVAIPLLCPIAAIGLVAARIQGVGFTPTWTPIIRMPAGPDPRRWKTFRLWRTAEAHSPVRPSLVDFATRVWPGLFAVAAGRMRLVGLAARSAEELSGLSHEAREVVLSGRPGIITEAMVRLEPDATGLERDVAEACHAATGGLLHDLKLAGRYATLALRNTLASPRPRSLTM